MTEEKFLRIRSAFRHQMAELSIREIRDYTRVLRVLRLLDSAQLNGLMDDMKLMLDYKSKKLSAAEAWQGIERSWLNS